MSRKKKPLAEFEVVTEDKQPVAEPSIRCMADVPAEAIEWLWPARIAVGKLNLLVGDGGVSKSTLTADLASTVSRGAPWPDRSGSAPIGDVLFMSAEDDPGDTIRPRLDAAGADVSRIHVLTGKRITVDGVAHERVITLEDLPVLEAALKQLRNVKMLVVDPVTSYLGSVDSYKDSEVRGVLAPLDALARKYRVAIVAVMHINKNSGQKAQHRISGSQGFSNAARLVWYVIPHTEDPTLKVLIRSKGELPPFSGPALC